MFGLPDAAIGAIGAAAIAGTISLLGLIIAKEQKVSEFRQAWIDALRKEVSMLISHANAIHASTMTRPAKLAEAWKDVRGDYIGINEATANIRLRLNADEPASLAILKTIERLELLLRPGQICDHRELNIAEKQLVDDVKRVLKTEWRRVRSGEATYKLAKYSALGVVAVSLLAIFGVVAGAHAPGGWFSNR